MRDTLGQLSTYLIDKKPEDPIPYMVQFLEDLKGIGAPALTPNERLELEELRLQSAELKKKLTGGSKQQK